MLSFPFHRPDGTAVGADPSPGHGSGGTVAREPALVEINHLSFHFEFIFDEVRRFHFSRTRIRYVTDLLGF